MRRLCCAAMIAAVGGMGAFPSLASTFIRYGIPELVRGADRGAYAGRVLELRSSWNTERTMIWTEVTVQATENLVGGGGAGRTLVFRVPGGRVGDQWIEMEGAPRFEPGADVVVFATSWPDGSLMVHGYFLGLSSIRLGADGRLVLAGGAADGMTLDDLRRAVRALGAAR